MGASSNALTSTPSAQGLDARTASTRAALYLRASSAKKTRTSDGEEYRQRPEIQEERLRRLCEQRAWQVVSVYCDRASGRKEQRPELTHLMQDARRGLFDVVAVAAFDRFARSVRHLVTALDEFRHLNIDFVSLREAIDTSTPMGRAMFAVVGAMAELESALISERTAAAMQYAQAHGTRTGQPIGRRHRVFRRDVAFELRQQGLSYRTISMRLGVPAATLHAALRSYDPRSEKAAGGASRQASEHGRESTSPIVPQGGLS
jgi:DNA invertase Pin-like site-specific DNA recombinase